MLNNEANGLTQLVLNTVARLYKMEPAEILTGKGPALLPRQVLMFVLKEADQPIKTILEVAGVKTPPSVYQALKKVKGLMTRDKVLAAIVEEIRTEMLTQTVSDIHTNRRPSEEDTGEPREYRIPIPRPSAAGVPVKRHQAVIDVVQQAVSAVMLNVALLRAKDPAAAVLLVRDTIIFYLWKNFPQVPQSETIEYFQLTQSEAFYTAIGRVTVFLEDDTSDLKRKFAEIRAKIPASIK